MIDHRSPKSENASLLAEIIDLVGDEGKNKPPVREYADLDVEVVRVPTWYAGTHLAAGATFTAKGGSVSVSIDGIGAEAVFKTAREAVDHYFDAVL